MSKFKDNNLVFDLSCQIKKIKKEMVDHKRENGRKGSFGTLMLFTI